MPEPTHADVARHVVYVAKLAVQKNGQINYTQDARRWSGIDRNILSPNVPPWADCSAFATWLFWDARKHIRGSKGVDIINGERWLAGYTGTMIQHGTRHQQGVDYYIPGRTCVFYAGSGSVPTHVAVYIGNGKVASHGSNAGPKIENYDYRRIVQARAYQI